MENPTSQPEFVWKTFESLHRCHFFKNAPASLERFALISHLQRMSACLLLN